MLFSFTLENKVRYRVIIFYLFIQIFTMKVILKHENFYCIFTYETVCNSFKNILLKYIRWCYLLLLYSQLSARGIKALGRVTSVGFILSELNPFFYANLPKVLKNLSAPYQLMFAIF